MPTRVRLLLAVVLLAAPRCAAPPVPPGPAVRAAPTSGCAAAEQLRAGTHRLGFGGIERRFLLSLPRGDGPHPVILDLHGLNSSAARQAAYGRLPEAGARRGYIVATPQAAKGRMGWTLPGTTGPDDAGFLAALLDHLERGLCVETRREFAAGMSYGAAMATSLICALDGRLAAVAAVAGLNIARPCPQDSPTTPSTPSTTTPRTTTTATVATTAPGSTATAAATTTTAATSIVAFHGTDDRVVPYRGGHPLRDATGDLRTLADLIVLDPVERAAAGWADRLGCTGRTIAALPGQVRLRDWKTCPGGTTLRLYTIDGGGHTWPGAAEMPWLGRTTRDLDATALILDTFDHAPSR
ncbi:hypothetical protein AB0I81_29385 [Nonomuraea sp. NPDC050404]|uniref:alpha/beta hydrolase family esterase n=1 Tax=Nonomuraea sp. NPDC050404 TaxID=3155783 RepID=UPI0033F475B1